MDDHVSGLPKLVVPGKVNWELQDTFHIKTADAIVRITWDRDSYCIVKATEGDVASRVIAAEQVQEYIRSEDPLPNSRSFYYRWRVAC